MYEFRRLGFKTYSEYLKSDLWQGIRSKVLERDRRCVGCRRRSTQVHHKSYSYEALTGVDLSCLVGICHGCHKRIHSGNPDLALANGRIGKLSKRKRRSKVGKSRKKRIRAAMCPECGVNRRWHGGACPFCVRAAE